MSRRRPTPAPRVAGLTGYVAPSPAAPADLRLDGTERTALPREVAAGMPRLDASALHAYPSAGALEARLAKRFGVEPNRVIVTAGADEALDRLCRAVLAPGRGAVVASPTFEMLPRYARLAGGTVRAIPWPRGPFPEAAFGRATGRSTALLGLVSPNNPTGLVVPAAAIRRLAARAPHAVVLADFAYIEFADVDPTRALLTAPNVVVVRTFSKALGLAGLRVGYALGPADVIGWMRGAGGPYAVARPSIACAAARLSVPGADVRAYIRAVRRERAQLVALLARLGAEPLPSQANFVLARFRDAAGVRAGLAARGIAVRTFPDRPELAGWLRIACPANAADFARLARALAETLPGRNSRLSTLNSQPASGRRRLGKRGSR